MGLDLSKDTPTGPAGKSAIFWHFSSDCALYQSVGLSYAFVHWMDGCHFSE